MVTIRSSTNTSGLDDIIPREMMVAIGIQFYIRAAYYKRVAILATA